MSIDRGFPAYLGRTSPWLLLGAKTLSYAVNMAALREAPRRAIWRRAPQIGVNFCGPAFDPTPRSTESGPFWHGRSTQVCSYRNFPAGR